MKRALIWFMALYFIVMWTMIVPSINYGQLKKKNTVAVLEFNNAGGADQSDMAILTNRFRTYIVKAGEYDILEREKMREILKEQDFQLTDNCNTSECVVQIGKLLGVEKMIAGDIGKIGEVYTIDVRLINVTTGKIEYTESRNHKGNKEELLDLIEAIAFTLSGKAVPTKGTINLVSRRDEDEAIKIGTVTRKTGALEINNDLTGILYVDGQEIGPVTPGTIIPIENLKIGFHQIEIHDQLEIYSKQVEVLFDQVSKLSTKEMSRYKKVSEDIYVFTDSRDQSTYRYIRIGNTSWMLDNLKFAVTGESFCYSDNDQNCFSTGRLYTWEGAKKAVPEGWRLPTKEDWENLFKALPSAMVIGKENSGLTSYFFNIAGGWKSPDGAYRFLNDYAAYWSATEAGPQNAWFSNYMTSTKNTYIKSVSKKYGFAVRCVK